MTDDALLERLRSLQPDLSAQIAECDRVLSEYQQVARKARWAYEHYLSRIGRPRRLDPRFVQRYLQAWRDSILCVVNGCSSITVELPRNLEKTVLAGWHFPEYPALLPLVAHTNTLVLVASQEPWLEPLRRQGCTYCFRQSGASTVLLRSMRAGRPVFAMFDHCYDESRSQLVEFLSFPVKAPVGLLELARRFDYRIALLSKRARKVRIVCEMQPSDAIPHVARQLTCCIESEILRRPSRWLLWPAVPQRWLGVNFEESCKEREPENSSETRGDLPRSLSGNKLPAEEGV